MEDGQKKLTITMGEWCERTAELIGQALQHATTEQIKQQLDHGAKLFHIMHQGEIVGAFVLRIDNGTEGVIVAGTAKLQGVDMLAVVMPEIEKRFVGCHTVRYHTARPALAKRLLKMGYAPREIVCMKTL
jgi:hypothetical protein